MNARYLSLFVGVVLLASGVARADYTGVPIDGIWGPYMDNFNNSLGLNRSAPGTFYLDGYDNNAQFALLWTAVFTNTTLTLTDKFHLGIGFEFGFFTLDPPPQAFDQLTLLYSNFSPSLSYTFDAGDLAFEWPGTDVQDQTMTAIFRIAGTPSPVPEPSSLALLGTGCLYGLNLIRSKRT